MKVKMRGDIFYLACGCEIFPHTVIDALQSLGLSRLDVNALTGVAINDINADFAQGDPECRNLYKYIAILHSKSDKNNLGLLCHVDEAIEDGKNFHGKIECGGGERSYSRQ